MLEHCFKRELCIFVSFKENVRSDTRFNSLFDLFLLSIANLSGEVEENWKVVHYVVS